MWHYHAQYKKSLICMSSNNYTFSVYNLLLQVYIYISNTIKWLLDRKDLWLNWEIWLKDKSIQLFNSSHSKESWSNLLIICIIWDLKIHVCHLKFLLFVVCCLSECLCVIFFLHDHYTDVKVITSTQLSESSPVHRCQSSPVHN